MSGASRKRLLAAALPALVVAGAAGLWSSAESVQGAVEVRRRALTYPDYSETVVPPNIAPLDFKILEPGKKFRLRVSGRSGSPIEISSGSGKIRIPAAAWRALLEANRGGELRNDIYVKGANGWTHFETARNRVAGEAIDPYVVYRYIPPVYDKWDQISLRQRNLQSFEERVVFDNQRSAAPDGKNAGSVCVNCHTFLNHSGRNLLIHMRPAQRGQIPAMILVRGGQARKIDTRNGQPAATYTTWHPSGKLLAFSRNSIVQIFHTAGVETREVIDRDSDLALYDVEAGRSFTVPQISRPDVLETFPAWSPDGRYLYFCSARLLWTDKKNGALKEYDKIQYDLSRIAYDPDTGQWGQVETVVAASQFGRSISLPQISPDGRYVMFCGHAYGAFPIFQTSADLYLLDLRSGSAAPRRLDEINSDRTDSYHTWSSNGRWVIFSSKREDGIFARLFIAHLEEGGRFGKPFLMPQEDADFYGRCLMTYNRPELISEPVSVTPQELTRAINTISTPGAATPPADAPWQSLK